MLFSRFSLDKENKTMYSFELLVLTLTLVEVRVSPKTHCLNMVNICANVFQNTLISEKVSGSDTKRHYNRTLYYTLTSKCDLDLWGRILSVVYDMWSYYDKHVCHIISKSFYG
jgi:hypothetical protein